MGKIKVELEEGKRVLYYVEGDTREIREGTISKISPSGKYFKIDRTWYCEPSTLGPRGPASAEILDELPGESSTQAMLKKGQDDKSWPRPSY